MMTTLDNELVSKAKEIISKRYVEENTNHTVGCALRTKQGKIYVGVNLDMDGMHSVCAEQVAFGSALTAGEKDFDTIVAVGMFNGVVSILAPCGTCRQFMSKYSPDINVIIENKGKLKKVSFSDLLPFAYKLHVKR